MDVDGILNSPALRKAAVTFAAGYARRIMEGQYTRLMDEDLVGPASDLSRTSKYAVEAVLNGIVAWLSTKEDTIANTPLKEFLWETIKDAPSEISKRLLNKDGPAAINGERGEKDKRAVLDGLLQMDADDLSAFLSWIEQAAPEERRHMAQIMSKLTEEECGKLRALTPEQLETLFSTALGAGADSGQTSPSPSRQSAVTSFTEKLREINERLEKRKPSS